MNDMINQNQSSEIPPHWVKTPLGEILTSIVGGGTPSRSNPKYWDGEIPWFTVKDMRTQRPADSIDHISEIAVRESSTNIIPPDTIIIATRIGLGKVIRVPFEAAINQDLKALILPKDIDKGYVEYWILSISKHIESIGSGTTVKGIRLEQVRSLSFPLAPLNEQKRIVAEIEKQFSRLDEAVENLQRVKANLKRYKASVLKAAVEGKLTEQWRVEHPDVEPASRLLECILKERCKKWEENELAKMKAKGRMPKDDKWKKKYKEINFQEIRDKITLPAGWVWTRIGQVFEVCIGATPSRKKAEYWNGSIPWVCSGEVAFCRVNKTRETISKLGLSNSSTIVHPIGTVMLGMIGEGKTRGQAAILDIEACNNQNAAAIRVSDTAILPEYVYSFLEKEYEETRRRGSGGNQPALNKSRVMNIPFPLPPIKEQIAIVEKIQKSLSNIESLSSIIDIGLLRANRLRQSILKKAFSGRLIPSLPAYGNDRVDELPMAAEATSNYGAKC